MSPRFIVEARPKVNRVLALDSTIGPVSVIAPLGSISGATNRTYSRVQAESAHAGYYSVLVTNSAGSASSTNALLLLLSADGCAGSPSNTVSMWRGDSSATDALGTNHGTLRSGVSYASGKVRQAFSFNGASSYVQVPDSSSLDLTNQFTVECWYKDTGSPGGAWYGLMAKRAPWPGGCNFGINFLPSRQPDLQCVERGERGHGVAGVRWPAGVAVGRDGASRGTGNRRGRRTCRRG